MDTSMTLLKQLKAKHVISGKAEESLPYLQSQTISLRKPTDLFIRDAITGLGTILASDSEQHYYVTTVPSGILGNVLTYAIIQRKEAEAEIVIYSREGLIKQNLAGKAFDKLKKALC